MATTRKFRTGDDTLPKYPVADEAETLFADLRGPVELMGKTIAVLDRGYCHIGYGAINGDWLYLRRTKNIRRWGTTAGLGQLKDGPRQETVLDDYGDLRIPLHAVLFFIAVDQDKWDL